MILRGVTVGGFGIGDFFYVDDGGDGGWHPGGRDPRLPLFAQGHEGAAGKPAAGHALMLWGLCGADGSCPGATDDEALGLISGWARVESWVFARKLDVIRELSRRRPDPADNEHLAREVSLALGLSVTGARKLIDLAWSLEIRIPRIGQALNDGLLDPSRVRMIADETAVLEAPDMLARAEAMILAGLGKCRTWTDLLRLVQRAVCTVDPEGARKRRERAEREDARLRFWREAAGTCGLSGTGLPPDEALAAMAHVEQRAQEYRRAGVKRYIEILRVAACLDLLNGVPVAERVAMFRAEDAGQAPSEERAAAQTQAQPQAREGAETRAQPQAREGAETRAQPQPRAAAETEATQAQARDDAQASAGDRQASAGAGPADEAAAGAGRHAESRTEAGEWPVDWPTEVPPCGYCDQAECRCGDPAGSGDSAGGSDLAGSTGPEPGGPDREGRGSSAGSNGGLSFAARTNLTLPALDIPLLTALGLARRPGEARGLGALDPALARRLAEAAARNPDSEFCVTIVNGDGHAIGHGCARPMRDSKAGSSDSKTARNDFRDPGPRESRASGSGRRNNPNIVRDSLGGERDSPESGRHGPKSGRDSPGGERDGPKSGRHGPKSEPDSPPSLATTFAFTPSGKPGPPGGFGSWILTLPRNALPRNVLPRHTPSRNTPSRNTQSGSTPMFTADMYTVDLYRVPTGECDHAYESAGHNPTRRLRHLVQVRDGKCGFPTCSRHARESDLEHAIPHGKGGRTCGCNCWACSRSCHQLKQSDGWQVNEIRPGYHQWATPSGRTYVQEPWRYPA